MLQYNQKQYNPLSATNKANINRHWFYAVIFEDNPKYIDKMLELAVSGGTTYSNETAKNQPTDEDIINGSTSDPRYFYDLNTHLKYYTFDVTLYDNSADNNCFWQFNVDGCYDALVIKHGLQSADVETYVWLKHPIHKRLFYEYTNIDNETTIIKFYKGKLPPRVTVTIQLRALIDNNYSGIEPVNNNSNTNATELHINSVVDNISGTTQTITQTDENEKPEIALMFRAGTLEGLYSIIETIDEEYWKSCEDDYVAHTIRDYRKKQDVKVMIYYKNNLDEILNDLGNYYKIIKTWLENN